MNISGNEGLNKPIALGEVSTKEIGYAEAKKAIQQSLEKVNTAWQRNISQLKGNSQLQRNTKSPTPLVGNAFGFNSKKLTSVIKNFSQVVKSFENKKKSTNSVEFNSGKISFVAKKIETARPKSPVLTPGQMISDGAESERVPQLEDDSSPNVQPEAKPDRGSKILTRKNAERKIPRPRSLSESSFLNKTPIPGQLVSDKAESERVPDLNDPSLEVIEKNYEPKKDEPKISNKPREEIQGPERDPIPEFPDDL